MIEIAVVAAAMLVVRRPRAVCGQAVALVAALAAPLVVPVAVVAAWLHAAQPDPHRAVVVFFEGVAAELRTGATLRGAIVSVGDRSQMEGMRAVVRRAGAGRPIAEVSAAAEAVMATVDLPVRAALEVTAKTGAGAASAMTTLGDLARRDLDRRRTVHSETAAARWSTFLLTALPVGVLGVMWWSGRLAEIAALGSLGLLVVGAGVGLVAAGAVVSALVVRSQR